MKHSHIHAAEIILAGSLAFLAASLVYVRRFIEKEQRAYYTAVPHD